MKTQTAKYAGGKIPCLRTYKKEDLFSYTSGTFGTVELLKRRPEAAERIYLHSSLREKEFLKSLCREKEIPWIESDKVFRILKQKENSYAIGVFRKYPMDLDPEEPHIVLVQPSDMGNLGTIIRTMAGLSIRNLAIIQPGADIWNPKTIRASMGAVFHIRYSYFQSFSEYAALFPFHSFFPFMLKGSIRLEEAPSRRLFSLIFGNEASGLEESFSKVGRSIRIPFTADVDSFNLAVAAGIGMYAFAIKNNLLREV